MTCRKCGGRGFVFKPRGDDDVEDACFFCGGTGEVSLSEAEEVGLPKYRRAEIPLGKGVRER